MLKVKIKAQCPHCEKTNEHEIHTDEVENTLVQTCKECDNLYVVYYLMHLAVQVYSCDKLNPSQLVSIGEVSFDFDDIEEPEEEGFK